MFWESKVDAKEFARLQEDVSSLTAEKLALEARLEDESSTIENFALTEQTYKKQITSLKNQLKTVMDAKDAEVLATKNTVTKQINSVLASIGVNTFATETFSVSTDTSDMEALNTFNGLTGQEKTEFYGKNKAKISRALLKKT